MVIRTGVASAFLVTFRWCFLLFALSGCHSTDEDAHHELSHTNPPHWPNDLTDAHSKLTERFEKLRAEPNAQPARKELSEIVSWLPEVAADTDILESEWQSIFDQSELLRLRLDKGTSVDDLHIEIEQLLRLIQELPKSQANNGG